MGAAGVRRLTLVKRDGVAVTSNCLDASVADLPAFCSSAACGHLASASRTCTDRGQDLTGAQIAAGMRRGLRLWIEDAAKACNRLPAFGRGRDFVVGARGQLEQLKYTAVNAGDACGDLSHALERMLCGTRR